MFRILCVAKMSFLEETIGEPRVRVISVANTLTISLAVTAVFFAQGQSTTGTVLTILTGVNFIKHFTAVSYAFS
jgi:hypothetical protein